MPEFRAQTRIMPFLMFFALLILGWLIEECLAAENVWTRRAGWLLPVVLTACALPAFDALARDQKFHQTLFGFGAKLETGLPAMLREKDRGGLKAIFQLPVAPWPEAEPRNGFSFYSHELPFVFDRSVPPTNWSYGSARGQPGADEMRAAMREDEPTMLAARARRFGFDGLLVEKMAYTPAELSALEAGIAESIDASCRIYNDEYRELFTLTTAPSGQTCLR